MSETAPTPLHLIPDAPITDAGYDRLDRMAFVRSFAQAIGAVEGEDSVVLALAGPWGSGKSSLLNLVALELDVVAEKPPLVMRFNPWWFSGSDRLVAAFLQQLAAAISRPAVKDTLGTATPGLDRLSVAIAEPGQQSLSDDVESLDIEYIRHEVDAIFSKSERRVLIMMDDIDRLTPSEMSQLLLIVRVVADFPNTTYVLSFDYEVVVDAIGDKLGVDGRTYLEKVVQLQIDVPLPGRMTLERLVVGQLAAIDPAANALDSEAQRYFRILFEGGIKHFLATPRACTRLLNVVRFTYPTSSGQVYFPDLLGICCLMAFSSQAIRSFSESFVGHCDHRGRGWLNLKKFHSSWLSDIPDRDRGAVESIVRLLFPKVSWALDGPERGEEYVEIWEQDMRICSEKNFDAYFRLGLTAGEAAERQWRNMVALMDDATAFAQALQRFGPLEEGQGTSWVGELLQQASDFVGSQATPEQARNLFQAILRRGDQIAAVKDDQQHHFTISPVHSAVTVLVDCLQRIEQPKQRLEALTQAVSSDASLLATAELLELLEYRIDLFADGKEVPSVEANTGKLLKILKKLVARIEKTGESGELAEHPLYMKVVQKWHHFGRRIKSRKWVKANCKSDEFFVEGLVQVAPTAAMLSANPEETVTSGFPLEMLVDLFGRDFLLKRCKNILKRQPDWLTNEGEQVLNLVELMLSKK